MEFLMGNRALADVWDRNRAEMQIGSTLWDLCPAQSFDSGCLSAWPEIENADKASIMRYVWVFPHF